MIFQYFPHTVTGTQIWLCRIKVIIWTNGRLSPGCYISDSVLKLSWLWRRRSLSIFTIYGQCGNFTERLWEFVLIFNPPFDGRLHMKFKNNWPRDFRRENVQRYGQTKDRQTDRRTTDGEWSQYLIPSLRLKSAKIEMFYFQVIFLLILVTHYGRQYPERSKNLSLA